MSLVMFVIDLVLAIATAIISLAMAADSAWMAAWILTVVSALAALNAGALSSEM